MENSRSFSARIVMLNLSSLPAALRASTAVFSALRSG